MLADLEELGKNSELRGKRPIIDNISFIALTKAEVEQQLIRVVGSQLDLAGPAPHVMLPWTHYLVDVTQIVFPAENPDTYSDSYNIYRVFIGLLTLRLDGRSRLSIPYEAPMGDLQVEPAPNNLALLFREDSLRERLREIVFDAFGKYFVIDPTNGGNLRVRLSNRPPHSEGEEQGLTAVARAFHAAALPIHQASDGVRAFIGIMMTLIAGDPQVILVDEPEAFLHPALAMKLGKEISRSLSGSKKRLFASTHSASFLMGCIQSGSQVNIVRLTYKEGTGTTRILSQEKLLHLMRNPMLRSTGILDGLFYEAVIVTEAAADRAFYQEINERLNSSGDSRGINNCLFINAQNKQTIWDIVKPLRELGIPAVGIVDLDFIKEGVLSALQRACVPPMQQQPMSALSASIRDALNATTANGNDWKTSGGITLLSGTSLTSANNHFDDLERYGIFVVRSGELESWLDHLDIPHDKNRWLRRIFERMREDPLAHDYVRPASGDVWDFIGHIRHWIDNPNRQGIPE